MEVKGYSMAPALRPGDRVEVVGVEPSDLCVGDLVVLDTGPNGWVIHRFFGWRADQPPTPRTKGDASPRFDPIWPGARLLGRVRAFERGARRRGVRRGWLTLPWILRSILVLIRARLRMAAPGRPDR